MSDLPGLSSARIMLSKFSQNPHYPWCFLLVIFHPLPSILFLGYKQIPTCPCYTWSWTQSLSSTAKFYLSCPYNYHLYLIVLNNALPSLTSVTHNFFFITTCIAADTNYPEWAQILQVNGPEPTRLSSLQTTAASSRFLWPTVFQFGSSHYFLKFGNLSEGFTELRKVPYLWLHFYSKR